MELPSLGVQQPGNLLHVIENSLNISQRHHFFLWAQGALQGLLPHEALICCLYGRDGLPACVQQFAWRPYFTEMALLQSFRSRYGLFARLLETWRGTTGAVQVELAGITRAVNSPDNAAVAESLAGFSRAAIHGVRGHDGNAISAFVFLGISDTPDERHSTMLELVVPHIHGALVRALSDENSQAFLPAMAISARECEILQLISDGKTNPEIAQILYLSPLTVKNHARNIFKKLGVSTRSQAVACAINLRLIRN